MLASLTLTVQKGLTLRCLLRPSNEISQMVSYLISLLEYVSEFQPSLSKAQQQSTV